MKKSLLAIAAMFGFSAGYAQYYSVSATNIGFNPGNLHQEQEQPPAFMTANYTGYTQILNSGATTWSAVQTIPFSFEFNGSPVSSFVVAPTGVVSFTTSASAVPTDVNTALPSTLIPDNSICAWGMNIAGANDGVVVKTFGTSPRRQTWIIWCSASESGLIGTQWTNWSIVLEESTNHIYIGDLRTYGSGGGNVSLTVGVQIDTNEAYQLSASPNVQSNTTATSGNGADPSDNTYYLFGFGNQPATDLDNIMVTNNYYVEVNEATLITGLVVNHGSAAVTSAQINYTAGSANETDNVNGINIMPGTAFNYTLPTAWTPTVEGLTTITTTVNQSNGTNETITANNVTSKQVLVHPTPVTRKPLLEQFTSSTCPPCVPGNINVQSVIANYPNQYSKINYQMSWPGTGDPYFTMEGQDRRTFYGVNSVPSFHVDGAPGMNSTSFTAGMMNAALDVPAFVDMTIEAILTNDQTFEVQNGQFVMVDETYNLEATATMTPVIDMPAGLVAHISIQEDLTFDNVKTNGETEFHDVMKKMLPDAAGFTLPSVNADATHTLVQTHEFPLEYRLPNNAGDPINHATEHSIEDWDDLRAVAWVQNATTGEIWQSENAEVQLVVTTNIDTTVVDGETIYTVDGISYNLNDGVLMPLGTRETNVNNIAVYPNPATDIVQIAGVYGRTTINIYDATGRLVLNSTIHNGSVDVSSLPAGAYNISIENNGVVKVEKLSVVR